MLNWTKRFNIFCYLDNHQYPHEDGYECLLGVNAIRLIDDSTSFGQVDTFLQTKSWYFGHLSYDLKNELYGIKANKNSSVGFPHFFFFEPEFVLLLRKGELVIHADDPDTVYKSVTDAQIASPANHPKTDVKTRLDKQEYLDIISKLKEHIHRGDCYEINFCQEFFAENCLLDPLVVFERLNEISPTPFSAFYRVEDNYLLCASPERFIKKEGEKISSQPMKGTVRRDLTSTNQDNQLKVKLQQDAKERAENVMVVDLVRNDLSKICREGSVQVDELFGIYSFPQVHQMVSTISGELKPGISFSQIIDASFPMGSMTGAPKLKVMQLIDQYEPVARGLFSGSVGYIDPDGNFDFNVVIRSILYNRLTQYLSFFAGSGITFYSDAEKEWEECLLKAQAIKKVLTS